MENQAQKKCQKESTGTGDPRRFQKAGLHGWMDKKVVSIRALTTSPANLGHSALVLYLMVLTKRQAAHNPTHFRS
jgi:hypothetical protein